MPADTGTARLETHGDFSLWVERGARIAPRSIVRVIEVAERFGADLVYVDGVARIRGRKRIFIRPDFSPIRLLEQDYLGDAILVRNSAVDLAGLTSRADLLRAAWRLDPGSIVHVPEVLTRRVGFPPREDVDAHHAATAEQLERWAVRADIRQEGERLRVVPLLDDEPSVSIIIPTRGTSAAVGASDRVLVLEAVRSIIGLSSYQAFEIVVVADDVTPQGVIDDLVSLGGDRLTIARWSGRFNFSGKINRGASHARGEYFLLLNDDIDVISPDWIQSMVGLCRLPGVGMVGANLLFEDGTVQHAGHFYEARGAGHIASGWTAGQDDAVGSLGVDREVSGVTAACALVSREAFERVGGLSTLFPGNYNDVDFSMKVRQTGDEILWTPSAKLHHYESQTRDAATALPEQTQLRKRWGTRIEVDPYWLESIVPVRN